MPMLVIISSENGEIGKSGKKLCSETMDEKLCLQLKKMLFGVPRKTDLVKYSR